MLRALVLSACLLVSPAVAQDGRAVPPILTLDQERLYANSLFAQRVRRTLDDSSRVLAAENRRIEAALVAEESQLTTDRAEMDPEEFRALAEDFDERVTGIRQAQATKRDALQTAADAERARFFQLAYPVLFELVEETGALAILNQSAVILSSRSIDVTEQAIERVNDRIGEAPPPIAKPDPPAPRPDPQEPAPDADPETEN